MARPVQDNLRDTALARLGFLRGLIIDRRRQAIHGRTASDERRRAQRHDERKCPFNRSRGKWQGRVFRYGIVGCEGLVDLGRRRGRRRVRNRSRPSLRVRRGQAT